MFLKNAVVFGNEAVNYIRCKICGITNVEDALLSVSFGADALGFIMCESKRRISVEKAREIFEHIPPFVNKVLVVRNMSRGEIGDILSELSFDSIQFHGDEDEDFCLSFSPLTIIKAVSISSLSSLSVLSSYSGLKYFLLDSYSLGGGGSGEVFNWSYIARAKELIGDNAKVILAGGLNVSNIDQVVRDIIPYGVDVSSGLESVVGKKDASLLKEFIYKLRGYL